MPDAVLDDVEGLWCFAQVVQLGSFTKAAQALGVSKSTVSTKVANLEARLGQALLLRTTRRVTTTAAGARTYAHARMMLEAAALATEGASDATRGLVRISAPVSLGQMYLAEPLATFLRENPGARIELMLNDRLVDLVEERIDLALRITKLADSNLIARRLASVPLHVCAAPAYLAKAGRPLVPEDLLRHNCLRYGLLRADHEWRLYSSQGRVRLEPTGNFETSNGTMLREAAVSGMGIAILPEFMIASAVQKGQLEILLSDFEPHPLGLYAVWAGKRVAPPLVRNLVNSLVAAFRGPAWRGKAL